MQKKVVDLEWTLPDGDGSLRVQEVYADGTEGPLETVLNTSGLPEKALQNIQDKLALERIGKTCKRASVPALVQCNA